MTSRSILDTLQNDLSPDSWPEGSPPLIVAQPRWKQMRKKTDLPVIPRKLQGPRKTVRSFKLNGLSANWPNDELYETRVSLLMYVLAGKTDYCCGDYVIQVPAGHAIFVPAGVPHRGGAASLKDIGDDPQRLSDNILFSERCGSLQVWLNHDRGNHHYRSDLSEILMVNNTRLIRLLEEMDDEVSVGGQHYEKVIQHLLGAFLWTLRRSLLEKKTIQLGRLADQDIISPNNYTPIPTAQQYIRENLREHLTQDKVARMVRLSRTQFIHRFRQETGQTFNQFVTACRLEQAKVLLQETNFPLRFVHQSLGYKSLYHFNTVFRKHLGMLPSEFRAQERDQ